MTVSPAPYSRESVRKARSVTPAIGASITGVLTSTFPIRKTTGAPPPIHYNIIMTNVILRYGPPFVNAGSLLQIDDCLNILYFTGDIATKGKFVRKKFKKFENSA